MEAFKRDTRLQKWALQELNKAVKDYLQLVCIPQGYKHYKTVLEFSGRSFKPSGIDCHITQVEG